jgi:hypothetical protein
LDEAHVLTWKTDMKDEFAAVFDPGGLQTTLMVEPLVINHVIAEHAEKILDSSLSKQQLSIKILVDYRTSHSHGKLYWAANAVPGDTAWTATLFL